MPFLYTQIALFCAALLLAALFAFLETSFTALRLFKLKELQVSISRYKNLFATWEKNPQQILITILIANNFAHVICSVLITEIMQHVFGTGSGLAIGIGLATTLILVFGEIIPKSWAKAQHERLFGSTLWIVSLLLKIFYPFVRILMGISNFFYSSIRGGKPTDSHDMVTEKEIEFLIDYSDEQGLMEAEKSEMLQNVFDLGSTFVYEIIIPKTDVVAIEASASIEQAKELFSKHRFSRLPVYENGEDNVIGLIYQKDVFRLISAGQTKTLKEILRPVLYVPDTKRINQLLSEFLQKRMHMAIVIDEYGAVSGLVTLEDILEEIVGEIRDEDEKVQAEVVPLEKGGWLVDGRMSLDKLSETMGIGFDVEESVTVSGFLTEKLQHLPRKGERVFYQGYCFQVQQASRRRVLQVLIFKETQDDEGTNT